MSTPVFSGSSSEEEEEEETSRQEAVGQEIQAKGNVGGDRTEDQTTKLKIKFSRASLEDDDIESSEDDMLGVSSDSEDGEEEEEEMDSTSKVGIIFCDRCQTMMRPKENKAQKKIYYKCYHCFEVNRDIPSMIVSRNRVRQDRTTQLHIYRDELANDKTLSRTTQMCPKANCDSNQAVMFLGGSQSAKDEEVDLVFMCCKCNHKWVHEKMKSKSLE